MRSLITPLRRTPAISFTLLLPLASNGTGLPGSQTPAGWSFTYTHRSVILEEMPAPLASTTMGASNSA